MTAAGIDVGGTKIEAQIFDDDWRVIDRRRIETPRDYLKLVQAMGSQVRWIEETVGDCPIGISAAGLVEPETGHALTANLSATGQPFPNDIERASGRSITYLNDCRAFALSEATFGAGSGFRSVVGVIFGTGVGGGQVVDGEIVMSQTGVGGEFGHVATPHALAVELGLPVVQCGCGKAGCIERFLAGPGLERLARVLIGREMTSREIAETRKDDADVARVWEAWCRLAAELLHSVTLMIDPEVIVLGGGLSKIEGIESDLTLALRDVQFEGFAIPEIRIAEGGDASGARGAARAAWQREQADG